MSTFEQMASVLDRIAGHIAEHRRPSCSSTRGGWPNASPTSWPTASARTAVAGPPREPARWTGAFAVEARLRAGELRAVVATASLELGIDVGPVELVCQLGSPRSIATFLQRVGRAQHHVGGVPVGRLYPLTRDELVECTALLARVRSGDLDAVSPPVSPLDVLAQQLVAECAASDPDGCSEAELLALAPAGGALQHVQRGGFRVGRRTSSATASSPGGAGVGPIFTATGQRRAQAPAGRPA